MYFTSSSTPFLVAIALAGAATQTLAAPPAPVATIAARAPVDALQNRQFDPSSFQASLSSSLDGLDQSLSSAQASRSASLSSEVDSITRNDPTVPISTNGPCPTGTVGTTIGNDKCCLSNVYINGKCYDVKGQTGSIIVNDGGDSESASSSNGGSSSGDDDSSSQSSGNGNTSSSGASSGGSSSNSNNNSNSSSSSSSSAASSTSQSSGQKDGAAYHGAATTIVGLAGSAVVAFLAL
ncbi:hypothetical protein FA10DRAFT_289615 [Acaromyces ingoldii]|uniref:Hydrophobin n=1 Tax=Acaromyces ingoldii TaxID=215250 RepID=A0A316YET3_9BASI|nr:hypothetical protein FA10DRAFT_289615 [Acaromyces ingoldii]PWN86563.1 hypothetical protein FA10DRAFT_289615 [Acaromyces ingoldii]